MSLCRKLIYIPIIHTEVDLGSSAVLFKGGADEEKSKALWQEWNRAVEEMWQGIDERIADPRLNWSNVRLYQDGLPVCGRERDIVDELAKQGSINHQILVKLIHKGGTLEGTEDPRLLIEERAAIQRIEMARDAVEKGKAILEYATAGASLLEQRDQFIANQIGLTLGQGETGLLFVGMLHRVDRWLPKDIVVEYIIHHLPFGAAPWRFTSTA
ncbi:MAG: hypothetical protein HY709_04280 [Candidatus Latescibacteria bacterium]|nr:hypothetical protein [Candidatus Latescibacterota bacterium]